MSGTKDLLLDEALTRVVFDGWSLAVLEQSAAAIGVSGFEIKRAFPNGVLDAIAYFSRRADTRMCAELEQNYHLPTIKIRERIATAVMVRFRSNKDHREAVRRAMGVYALPWNAAEATRALYATVDAIWRQAGDTSTDYNFYTKRILLAGVYSSTLRVWLDDKTDDLSETEAFLRRRIDDVMQIEKLKAKALSKISSLGDWLPKQA